MKHAIVACCGALLLSLIWPARLPAAGADLSQREEEAIRAAVARVAPSVVRIQTVGGMETVDGALQSGGPATGLIVAADGLIVSSAYNFARQPTAILVTIGDRKNIPAKLVATDHSRALVLLKIEADSGAKLVVPEAAPAGAARPGAWAIAVGRTLEQDSPNVSVGIVSAVDRIWGKAIQTDAKISPANYGGPLVDIEGRVLGVLVPMSPMDAKETAGAEWYDSGIGFAVPLTDVLKTLPQWGQGRDLSTGLMGLALKGKDMFSQPAVIAACRPGTPAYDAGLRRGDRIVAAGGKPVLNQAQLRHVVGKLYAGDTVRLTVQRDNKRIDADLKLVDKLPPFAQAMLGVLPLRTADEKPGIPVRFVFPGSAAEKAGVKAGDRLEKIDGREIADLAAARETLDALAPKQDVALVVRRDGQLQTLTASLGGLTEAISSELPPARGAQAAEIKAAAGAVIDVKVPELPNACFAYVPAPGEPAKPSGLLIDLTPPGKFDKEQVVGRWKSHCDSTGTILLLPRPREVDRWQPDELEMIVRAASQIAEKYEIDPLRVAAVGRQGGGALALMTAFGRTGMLQGVAAIDTALPVSLRPQPLEPPTRLAVLLAHATDGPVAATLSRQIPRLRELGYAVTEVSLEGGANSLSDAQHQALSRWLDCLDRF